MMGFFSANFAMLYMAYSQKIQKVKNRFPEALTTMAINYIILLHM